jgi:ParB-like chromosome segregation protein Spo0J
MRIEQIEEGIAALAELPAGERLAAINRIIAALRKIHPNPDPVSFVQWVPADMVTANDYNPNNVAPPEMRLLYLSIKEDGYTQPIVTQWDEDCQKYVVVDGFHRNRVGKEYKDIRERTHGHLPIVLIDKPIENRMASTIRHNRARGKHSVLGMTNIVVELVQMGWSNEEIGKHLGMDADEVLRLKQVSGIAELFKNREYSRSWVLDEGRKKA